MGREDDDDGDTVLDDLSAALGVRFQDRGLLELALIHRSHAFEAGGLPTNERMEFLGDAVLGLVIADRIYRLFPDAAEGRLAKLRAATVNTRQLADLGRRVGVGDYVRLGRGEEVSGGRDKDSILADTVEALLGAIYLDQGLEGVTEVVHRLFDDLLERIDTQGESLDYKTALQELAAAEFATVPSYALQSTGPDHDKRFTAEVSVGGEGLGSGSGRSKKEAEQVAAREAIDVLQRRLAVGSHGRDTEDGGRR